MRKNPKTHEIHNVLSLIIRFQDGAQFGIIVPHFVIERLGYLGNKDRFIVPLLHCYIPIHLYTGFIGSHIIVFCPTFTLQVDDQSEKTTNIDEK